MAVVVCLLNLKVRIGCVVIVSQNGVGKGAATVPCMHDPSTRIGVSRCRYRYGTNNADADKVRKLDVGFVIFGK